MSSACNLGENTVVRCANTKHSLNGKTYLQSGNALREVSAAVLAASGNPAVANKECVKIQACKKAGPAIANAAQFKAALNPGKPACTFGQGAVVKCGSDYYVQQNSALRYVTQRGYTALGKPSAKAVNCALVNTCKRGVVLDTAAQAGPVKTIIANARKTAAPGGKAKVIKNAYFATNGKPACGDMKNTVVKADNSNSIYFVNNEGVLRELTPTTYGLIGRPTPRTVTADKIANCAMNKTPLTPDLAKTIGLPAAYEGQDPAEEAATTQTCPNMPIGSILQCSQQLFIQDSQKVMRYISTPDVHVALGGDVDFVNNEWCSQCKTTATPGNAIQASEIPAFQAIRANYRATIAQPVPQPGGGGVPQPAPQPGAQPGAAPCRGKMGHVFRCGDGQIYISVGDTMRQFTGPGWEAFGPVNMDFDNDPNMCAMINSCKRGPVVQPADAPGLRALYNASHQNVAVKQGAPAAGGPATATSCNEYMKGYINNNTPFTTRIFPECQAPMPWLRFDGWGSPTGVATEGDARPCNNASECIRAATILGDGSLAAYGGQAAIPAPAGPVAGPVAGPQPGQDQLCSRPGLIAGWCPDNVSCGADSSTVFNCEINNSTGKWWGRIKDANTCADCNFNNPYSRTVGGRPAPPPPGMAPPVTVVNELTCKQPNINSGGWCPDSKTCGDPSYFPCPILWSDKNRYWGRNATDGTDRCVPCDNNMAYAQPRYTGPYPVPVPKPPPPTVAEVNDLTCKQPNLTSGGWCPENSTCGDPSYFPCPMIWTDNKRYWGRNKTVNGRDMCVPCNNDSQYARPRYTGPYPVPPGSYKVF